MTTPTLVQGQPAVLLYDITNITRGFRDNEQTQKLKYTIGVDANTWSVGGATSGIVDAPRIAHTTTVRVVVTPKHGGSLQLPHLSLILEGEEGREKGGVALTDAQCYNLSHWQFVDVQE